MVKFTAVLASSAAFFAFALAAPVVTPFSSVPYWPLVSLKTFSSPHCHFEDANTQSWLIVDPASSGCHDFAVAKDQQVMSYMYTLDLGTDKLGESYAACELRVFEDAMCEIGYISMGNATLGAGACGEVYETGGKAFKWWCPIMEWEDQETIDGGPQA